MQFIYPDHILQDSTSCLTHDILQRIHGTQWVYLAVDTLKEANNAGLISPDSALDYTAYQTPPGLPSHTLTVKVNGVFYLLQNFSLDRGLVKNVHVVVVEVGTWIVTVRLLHPGNPTNSEGEDILILRISFLHQLSSGHTLLHCQFPLAPAYATTFNSCQGLTLDVVGIDLTQPVFSHGQLYTTLSHIRHHSHAKIHLHPGETTIPNVTYQEILI